MYGTRDAAQNWQSEYSQRLIDSGFTRGRASPCVFHHVARGIRILFNGDDYVSMGLPEQLKWMEEQLASKCQIKTQLLGPHDDNLKELNIFNRIIAWSPTNGIIYEADPRHVEIVVEQLGLKEAKPVNTPGAQGEGTIQEDSEQLLEGNEASGYRALAARCNYVSPDRLDISHRVKELARNMSSPTKGNWLQPQRSGRYLKRRPRLQQCFEWQTAPNILRTYSDAGWAGCRQTRKSTTGGCVTLVKRMLKGRSKIKSLVALSSGESELYATLKAAAETLGMISMMKDLGWSVISEVWVDASAVLGIINRRGLGKTRHVDIGLLWVQHTAAERQLKFSKALGTNNFADLYTKHLDACTIEKHTRTMVYEFIEGRAKEAPKLHVLQSDDQDPCQSVRETCGALNTNNSLTKRHRNQMVGSNCLCILERLMGSGQQVLRGTNWQVKGSNGRTIAQFDQLWGPTLAFQLNVGVSWAHGLRHGVATHPRGRHLREGMTLLFTCESQHGPVNSGHHVNIHNHQNHTMTKKFETRTAVRNPEGV